MPSSLHDLHNQALHYVKEGKFVESIEEFYAENATLQVHTAVPTLGRDLIIKNERASLENVTAYHGLEVLATAIGEFEEGTGIVFYEGIMQWEQSDIGHVTLNQVVIERWKDGKILNIRYFGNYVFGSEDSK